jgi:hypothetical protein
VSVSGPGDAGPFLLDGGEAPVTLRFLIEDYVRHQYWHMEQLTAPLAGS